MPKIARFIKWRGSFFVTAKMHRLQVRRSRRVLNWIIARIEFWCKIAGDGSPLRSRQTDSVFGGWYEMKRFGLALLWVVFLLVLPSDVLGLRRGRILPHK